MERLYFSSLLAVAMLMSPVQSEGNTLDKVKELTASRGAEMLVAVGKAADALNTAIRNIPVQIAKELFSNKILQSSGAQHGSGARGLSVESVESTATSSVNSVKNTHLEGAHRNLKHNVDSGQSTPAENIQGLDSSQKSPVSGSRGLNLLGVPRKHARYGARSLSSDNGSDRSIVADSNHDISGKVPSQKSPVDVSQRKLKAVNAGVSSPVDNSKISPKVEADLNTPVSGARSLRTRNPNKHHAFHYGARGLSDDAVVSVHSSKSIGDAPKSESTRQGQKTLEYSTGFSKNKVESGQSSPHNASHSISELDSVQETPAVSNLVQKIPAKGARGILNNKLYPPHSIPADRPVAIENHLDPGQGSIGEGARGLYYNYFADPAQFSPLGSRGLNYNYFSDPPQFSQSYPTQHQVNRNGRLYLV
ncbi:hypothetical protein GE061_016223 [Apolygus lucorum]|uniref:Uncharacterized protein n=1 Tax=Apolygus lucorum TaxID=248454 RepID=A0A6A4JV22_APOLU|nr:hypothetical protein GE061_016223 [Apolygus lucorum]